MITDCRYDEMSASEVVCGLDLLTTTVIRYLASGRLYVTKIFYHKLVLFFWNLNKFAAGCDWLSDWSLTIQWLVHSDLKKIAEHTTTTEMSEMPVVSPVSLPGQY